MKNKTQTKNNQERRTGRTFRLLLITLALALLTFSLALGTIARYSTSGGATDSARVAKFGVTIAASDNSSFSTEYTTSDGTITVKSSTNDKIVAPGTKDEGITFTISGKPEVNTRISITMDAVSDIFYKRPTNEYYRPVIFTLKEGNTIVAKGSLTDIEGVLNEYSSKQSANENINISYTLSWEWAYHTDGYGDASDTTLGDIAAGFYTHYKNGEDYCLDVEYAITMTIYQVVE